MIALLRGLVESRDGLSAVIDVHGVGYRVLCSAFTLDRLPPSGEAARLLIETEVREDAITLYGFNDPSERTCFSLLRSVQGVGAKVALAILSTLRAEQVADAIIAADEQRLTRADGVGRKLAQRIVNELKDKVAGIQRPGTSSTPGLPSTDPPRRAAITAATATEEVLDAVSALIHLGYSRAEAQGAVAKASDALEGEPSLDHLITAALKELAG